MLQSLATLMFALAAIMAAGLTAVLVRADWAAIRMVFGFGEGHVAPLPARVRRLAARRATMIELSPCALRRAA